jgi:hypothetical protein
MVSVLGEVRTAHLEHADRRQTGVGRRITQLLEPRAGELVSRPEVPVEVVGPVDRAHDALDRDLLDSAVRPTGGAEPAAGLVERQQAHVGIVPPPPAIIEPGER